MSFYATFTPLFDVKNISNIVEYAILTVTCLCSMLTNKKLLHVGDWGNGTVISLLSLSPFYMLLCPLFF